MFLWKRPKIWLFFERESFRICKSFSQIFYLAGRTNSLHNQHPSPAQQIFCHQLIQNPWISVRKSLGSQVIAFCPGPNLTRLNLCLAYDINSKCAGKWPSCYVIENDIGHFFHLIFNFVANSATWKVTTSVPNGHMSNFVPSFDAPGSELSSAFWFGCARVRSGGVHL